jgi:hypothetical protein
MYNMARSQERIQNCFRLTSTLGLLPNYQNHELSGSKRSKSHHDVHNSSVLINWDYCIVSASHEIHIFGSLTLKRSFTK